MIEYHCLNWEYTKFDLEICADTCCPKCGCGHLGVEEEIVN
ncbi:hypothetical protein N786_08975 [Bacillus amyloliquefaciens UASWS BA1]|nr:hypothetical protein N786_08975 [Bacillus amyloliquefaciens UASWS BA1]